MKTGIFFESNTKKYYLKFRQRLKDEKEDHVYDEMKAMLEQDLVLLENGLEDGLSPRFKAKNGIVITLALDNWDGVVLESEDKAMLETLQPTFEGLAN